MTDEEKKVELTTLETPATATAQDALQHRLAMLMDEIKSLFRKEMKITFIARHETDLDCVTVLSEDDLGVVADFIKQYAGKLTPIIRPESKFSN